ncbi:MAG: phosphatase PAP2 family protein, partial [Sporichthyaceae bacterium]
VETYKGVVQLSGFVDTMATIGPSAYEGSAATVANQFAAMPSLHVGWALLLAVVVIRTTTVGWRWLTLAHPAITTLVVVVTANHYWLDAVVAVALLAMTLAINPRPSRPAPADGEAQLDAVPHQRSAAGDAPVTA